MSRVVCEGVDDVEMRNNLRYKGEHRDEVEWGQEPQACHAAEGADEEVGLLKEVACNRIRQRGYVKLETFLHLSILN